MEAVVNCIFIGTGKNMLLLVLILAGSVAAFGQPPVALADGYATLNGGTTGGGSAAPITVTTATALKSAVENDTPAVIVIQGKLKIDGMTVGSNKTIIGADTNSGFYGGGLSVEGTNYIFQNLNIGPTNCKAMVLSGAKNVFIHKCEFVDCADGSLDILHQSDYVTVSWCKFYYVKQTSHRNTIVIGIHDKLTYNMGKFHVTLHHTWFAHKCHSRQPRVRFGRVHVYNNYYSNSGNEYCIGIGVYSRIRLENSHFESINRAWTDLGGTGSVGQMGWQGIKFTNANQPTDVPNQFPVFDPPYAFTLDKVDDVKGLVTDRTYGAGNCIPQ
jgi:pectate lyase